MKLVQLQRAVARAVMQPLTRNEGMRSVGPRGKSMRRYVGLPLVSEVGAGP